MGFLFLPVRLLQTRAELNDWRREQAGRPLHFVPTMGSLHQGHRQHDDQQGATKQAGGQPALDHPAEIAWRQSQAHQSGASI